MIRRGSIVETGPTEEVYAHPREAYTRELMDAFYYDRTDPIFG